MDNRENRETGSDFEDAQDREMRRAFDEALEQEFDMALKAVPIAPPHSEKHRRWEKRFLRKLQAHGEKSRAARPALSRVAGLVLAFLFAGSMALSTNAQAVETFFGWIGEQVQGMQGYVFEGGGTEEPVQVTYVLPEIPDGYSLWDVSEEDLNYVIDYANEEGLILEFGYSKPPTQNADTSNYFQTDGMEEKNCQINGVMADFFWDPSGEKGNALIWEDPENHVLLYLSGYLNEEEIVMLAESVQKAS